jgi:hypothetical protein
VLDNLDKPNPVDNKKSTDYYTKNRTIELDIKDEINHKDNWNLDYEAESLYHDNKEWKLENFLNSQEKIKVIAAPFGTGKTSFAKYTAQNMIINREVIKLNDTWIPIYISLKDKLVSDYRYVEFYHDLNEVIQPQQENVLLIRVININRFMNISYH